MCVFHLSASYDSSNDPLGALKKQRQFCQINGWGPLGSRSALRIGDFRHFLAAIFPWFDKKRVSDLSEIWEKGLGKWSLASYCGWLYSHYYKKGVSIDIFSNQPKKIFFFRAFRCHFFFQTWDHATLHHCTCQFYDFPVSRAQDTQSWKTFVSCTGRRSEFDSYNDTNRTDSGWILRIWKFTLQGRRKHIPPNGELWKIIDSRV